MAGETFLTTIIFAMNKTLLTLVAALSVAQISLAQEKSPCKFGKINPEDFQKKVYSIDSSADAVVLSDVGSSSFEGNNKSWFSLHFKRYTRIHILNKNGYDAATVEIPLYHEDDAEEQVINLKAVTYNLENGKITETKLEKSSVFSDKQDKNWLLKKFTLPNIKEGSIIEYQYEIQSDFLTHLQPWAFQGDNPVVWSEYTTSIPQFFSYTFLSQGYRLFDIKDSKDRVSTFAISETRGSSAAEHESFTSGITDYRWVMKNVPALKEESFTSTLKNHISKIEFQLSEFKDPLVYKNIMGTWPDLSKRLIESEYFGESLNKGNNWLGDMEKPLLTGAKTEAEKAARIYGYVRDNFTCTNHSSLYVDQTLKNVVKTRNGNEAEINILLTAMLRYADIKADPVILSTKPHGYTFELYPLISRFNYVISRAIINDKSYYFDASVPRLGYGKLMPYCYNGHARVINTDCTPVYLEADSLMERKVSSVFLTNNEQGDINGTMQQSMGYAESMEVRDQVKSKGQEDFVKGVRKTYPEDMDVSNIVIDSLNKPDEIVACKYDITIKNNGENTVYFNPMFGEGIKENPFKSAERFYPVEMPYAKDQTFILNMEVPKGYTVDEVPKSTRVKLNEQGDGMFEYLIQVQDNRIALRSRIVIKRTYFLPEEYDMLREFYNLLVKKQNEQIVFKKIK